MTYYFIDYENVNAAGITDASGRFARGTLRVLRSLMWTISDAKI